MPRILQGAHLTRLRRSRRPETVCAGIPLTVARKRLRSKQTARSSTNPV